MTTNKLVILALLFSLNSFAQQKFFHMYEDSAALIQDANNIVADFTEKVNAVKPVFTSRPDAILNTKPFLIFYSSKSNTVNLPMWRQVIPEQKMFFQNLAGNEQKGQEMFGLFFNGFYLAHELGHALQNAANKSEGDLYQNEYFANIVAVLYWREIKRTNELLQCYEYATQMVRKLANPVPEGEDPIRYFNEHYEELGADPYKYGYFQFAQFKKIYEDKSLKGFDEFIKAYLIK